MHLIIFIMGNVCCTSIAAKRYAVFCSKKKTNLTISINKFYGASEQALLIRVWIVCHKVDK